MPGNVERKVVIDSCGGRQGWVWRVAADNAVIMIALEFTENNVVPYEVEHTVASSNSR
jgi:hypothetical protein